MSLHLLHSKYHYHVTPLKLIFFFNFAPIFVRNNDFFTCVILQRMLHTFYESIIIVFNLSKSFVFFVCVLGQYNIFVINIW